jgi:ABC-2 type transport system ATP-binding protein
MTIFLTTQYLDEADALADRVGIINHGRIVAEGTPEELKRSIGTDVVIVRVGREADDACRALRTVPGIGKVEAHGREISVAVSNGAASISPIAVALDGAGVTVHELTLRIPTLDDVFLEVTGERITDAAGSPDGEPADDPEAVTR